MIWYGSSPHFHTCAVCHTVAQMDVEANLPIAPTPEAGTDAGVGGGEGGKQEEEGAEENAGGGGGEEGMGEGRRGGRKRSPRVTPVKKSRG